MSDRDSNVAAPAKPVFFDAHNHVQFAAFKNDWREVIDRALQQNIWMVIVGTQRDTSRRAVEIAESYAEGVYASVGLHPMHADALVYAPEDLDATGSAHPPDKSATITAKPFRTRGEEFDSDYYRRLAASPKVLTIGECGLDYQRTGEQTKQKQRKAFEQQILLARAVNKPLMIHCRDAFDDLIEVLRDNTGSLLSPCPGIVHFFTGTKEHAAALAHLGFFFTFGGIITHIRDHDDVIRMLPLDRILSETDAPYMTPVARDGRNEPANVMDVLEKIAEVRGTAIAAMRQRIIANAKSIFPNIFG